MKKINNAFIAGFFQGEGCVSITSSKGRKRIKVAITQVDKTVLLALENKYGGYLGQYAKQGNCRPYWQWILTSKAECKKFLKAIRPYLYGNKLKAVELGLEFLTTVTVHGRNLSEDMRDERERIYKEAKNNNKVGLQ